MNTKSISVFLITILLTTVQVKAAVTEEGTQLLLSSFSRDKNTALEKVLKRTKQGMNIQIAKAAYLCEVKDINTVIIGIADMYPQYTDGYDSLIQSAYKDEKEREDLDKRLGLQSGEGCKKVVVN